MDHADFQHDLQQFAHHVSSAASPGPVEANPVRASIDLVAEAKARQEKLRETVRTLQDSLDHLRLSVKYLVFDLEATRRENEYLRKLLEASHD